LPKPKPALHNEKSPCYPGQNHSNFRFIMGFKGWFEKFKEKGHPDGASELRGRLDSMPRSRRQHYVFAHALLRAISFEMGAAVVLLLANPERAADFLDELWEVAGRDQSGRDAVDPLGLEANVHAAGDHVIALVSLPAPVGVTEAYFVAIVSDPLPEPPESDDEGEVSDTDRELFSLLLRSTPIRYFTLEYGMSLDGSRRTTFCEWTGEGAHLNMGQGPAPRAETLLAFLVAQKFPPVRASFDPGRGQQVRDGE